MERSKISNLAALFFLLLCVTFTKALVAQNNYTVNGESLILYMEEQGDLNLLTERSQKTYRFFILKQDKIIELTPENYQTKLNELTKDEQLNVSKVNYNIRSLSQFIQLYNEKSREASTVSELDWRIGVWSGLSNFTNFTNEFNVNTIFTGIELELFSPTHHTRNSLFTHVRGTFPIDDELGVEFIELMLGYRFKLINTNQFHLYFDSELVTFGRYTESFVVENSNSEINETSQTNTSLSTPLGLGIGAAVFLSEELLLTFGYSNVVRLGESTRSDFPIDFRLGLKFGF